MSVRVVLRNSLRAERARNNHGISLLVEIASLTELLTLFAYHHSSVLTIVSLLPINPLVL